MNVFFSDRAFAALMAETTEKIQTETGGLFLGKVIENTWYIVETIDPGPKSIFEVAYFEYDQQYTQHLINKIANLYSERLDLVGLWHRHPGSFDIFSSTDDGTNKKYAFMRKEGAISGLVNIDPKFRLTMYHVSQSCSYTKIAYQVGNQFIPEKYMRLKTQKEYEYIMNRILNPESVSGMYKKTISLNSFMDSIEKYYQDKKYTKMMPIPTEKNDEYKEKLINELVPDIGFMVDELKIELQIIQHDYDITLAQDTIHGIEKVAFLYNQREDEFFFEYKGRRYFYEQGVFEKYVKMLDKEREEKRQDQQFEGKKENDFKIPSLGSILDVIKNR